MGPELRPRGHDLSQNLEPLSHAGSPRCSVLREAALWARTGCRGYDFCPIPCQQPDLLQGVLVPASLSLGGVLVLAPRTQPLRCTRQQ